MITKPRSAKILEPCSGTGVFLESLFEKGYQNIVAYELDSSLPNRSSIQINYCDFLDTEEVETYDVVIGNPPYVRWKNMPVDIRKRLVDSRWKNKINGLNDLLHAFIFLAADKLKSGGELIFITPFFWTETLHASPLRRHLIEYGELETLIMFDEIRIFKEVSSSIAIFKYVKEKTGRSLKVVHVFGKNWLSKPMLDQVESLLQRIGERENHTRIERMEAYLCPQPLGWAPWKPIPPNVTSLIRSIEKTCSDNAPEVTVRSNSREHNLKLSRLLEHEDLSTLGLETTTYEQVSFQDRRYYITREAASQSLYDYIEASRDSRQKRHHERPSRLGDIADIGNGLVSGFDKAFRITDVSKFTGKEKQKFIRVAKARDLRQYYLHKLTPYIFVNDVSSENELKEKYPNIYAQLNINRKVLSHRYDYSRNIPWWHWVFLRNWKLIESSHEKILTPCKERIDVRGYARFSYAQGQCYATQDVTVIVMKPFVKEDVKYILALLNSEALLTWLKYKGLVRGGVLEFSEEPLSRIPIRLIDWGDSEEVEIHNKIVNLVNEILKTHQIQPCRDELETYVRKLYSLSY